jgi:hypothetical protein
MDKNIAMIHRLYSQLIAPGLMSANPRNIRRRLVPPLAPCLVRVFFFEHSARVSSIRAHFRSLCYTGSIPHRELRRGVRSGRQPTQPFLSSLRETKPLVPASNGLPEPALAWNNPTVVGLPLRRDLYSDDARKRDG